MLFTSLFTLALAIPALAKSDETRRSRVSPAENHLTKRSFSGQATFYDVESGTTACGKYWKASDYIVALNTAQYGSGYPGPQCGKSITISYGGKTRTATIQDECPTCAYGALDLTEGLFTQFATQNDGVFQMTWWFNDDSSSEETTTSTKEAATSTYVAPTSTWVAPTSTYVEPTSTYVAPTSTYVAPTSTYVEPSTSSTPSPSSDSSTVESSTAASSVAPSDSSAAVSASASASASGLADSIIQSSNVTVTGSASNSTTASSTTSADLPLNSATSELMALGNLVALNEAVVNLGRILVVGGDRA
ncbi:hypothetical protein IAT38_000128 [Cryptococcus sp. DSM 104549]